MQNCKWKLCHQCHKECTISSTLKNIVLQFSLPIYELWDITMGEHVQKVSKKNPYGLLIEPCTMNLHWSPLFKKCNILKLQDIYKLQCCKLMYEFLKNNLPTPIMNIFTVNSDIHGHNTRQLNDVHLPKVKTDIVKRSYLCKAPVYWSQISNNVKSSKTINIFNK